MLLSQGVANLLVPMVGALALELFGNPGVATHGTDKGWSWRFVLALGALPGICLIPFKAAAKPKNPSAGPAVAPPGLMETLKMRKYWGGIVGCAGGWFLFDITFYGNSLFQSTVLKQVCPCIIPVPLHHTCALASYLCPCIIPVH